MTDSSRFAFHHLLATLLVFFSFVMAAVISDTVFNRLPHLEDELAYLFQARIFTQGDLVIDIPEPRTSFWQPFVLDYDETGKRFGKYSPGWPALLAVGVMLGNAWVINAFCAALTAALVYRLGHEIFNPEVGVVAAALVALSPMALLLNATLMGHTSALFTFTLFMYAFWRITQRRRAAWWGVLAGIALGLLVINRPLTAIGVVIPFILWSGLLVLRVIYTDIRHANSGEPVRYPFQETVNTLRPLVILGVITIILGLALPIFNYAASGNPRQNLYLLQWPYDQVGFGSCCGRSSLNGGEGHTILKGILHTRYDLSMTAADLFGWQAGLVDESVQDHARTSSPVWWPVFGLSFFLLPVGLVIGFKRRWLGVWVVLGVLWLVLPPLRDMAFLKTDANTVWLWLGVFFVWVLIPPFRLIMQDTPRTQAAHQAIWTWLLLAVFVGLIGIQLGYWIGSQRYSTRYYFEMLSAAALITALAIVWLAAQLDRRVVYGAFSLLLLWSLFGYSFPRIGALTDFNYVTQDFIDAVEARREGDRPILVIATDVPGERWTWRTVGSLMGITDPYLENDIIVARDYAPGSDLRERLLALFPDHQVIDMLAAGERAWFVDEAAPGDAPVGCIPGPRPDGSFDDCDADLPPALSEGT
ncbi:MAG: hypothetical protein OHK0046_31650 [Anaerolineae bacterium]